MDQIRRLQIIKDQWIELEKKDKLREIFGPNLHQYILKSIAPIEAIESGERYYRFKVPDEYKSYLTNVSNGGAGPCSGLFPLQHSLLPLGESYLVNNPNHYAKPFPFSMDDANQFKQELNQNKNFNLSLSKQAGGYLFLTEYGCGGFYILIVNGNCCGQVWYINLNSVSSENQKSYCAYPQFKGEKPLTFLDWIEEHLSYYLTEGNFIPDAEEEFQHPSSIKHLIITNKEMLNIPQHWFACKNVELIKINSCQLKKLDPKIKHFNQLRILDLFYNDLHDLPEEICELNQLKELYLKSNNIIRLPYNIGKLQQLEVLDISFTKIHQFPSSFFELQNLKQLVARDLNQDIIQHIRKNFPNLNLELQ
ncbi:MAG: hypothetical protein O9340_07325 [Cyclobacteriaceae bacterium]|nr:hypothetical protein [Cyclobacteriaceae bacterium]